MHLLFSRVILLCLTFLLSTAVVAQEAPDAMLKRVTQEVITALKQNDAELRSSPDLIYPIIDKILVPHIDWDAMAHWVAGRQAWQRSSEAQRERFSKEFKDLLVRTYASTLRAYNNQTIEYLPIRGGIQGKDRVLVSSMIKEPGREAIKVTYRMAKQGSQWLVYDISIEGVSLLKGFQSQFAQEIQQKGLDSLSDRLHKHNEKPLR